MKGKKTKEGRHYRAQAKQIWQRWIEIGKPREKYRAGRRRGKAENRKSPSSRSSREDSRRRLPSLRSPHVPIPPFLPSYTHSLHPPIYSMQNASTHLSFLPSFNIVTNRLGLFGVFFWASFISSYSPTLLYPLSGKQTEGQAVTQNLPAVPLLICIWVCELRSKNACQHVQSITTTSLCHHDK